jgi:hypothetical protein
LSPSENDILGKSCKAFEVPSEPIRCGRQASSSSHDHPDQFRLDRTGPAPLSFGYGAHYCLGAALTQLEAKTALTRIRARQPVQAGPVEWRDTLVIRGPLSVPIMFRASPLYGVDSFDGIKNLTSGRGYL